jgi:hypothetical protein
LFRSRRSSRNSRLSNTRTSTRRRRDRSQDEQARRRPADPETRIVIRRDRPALLFPLVHHARIANGDLDLLRRDATSVVAARKERGTTRCPGTPKVTPLQARGRWVDWFDPFPLSVRTHPSSRDSDKA